MQVKKTLSLDTVQLQTIVDSMLKEIEGGLARDGDSSMLMLPSHLTSAPTGDEKGDYLALDLGGTNFRVLKVCLSPHQELRKQNIKPLLHAFRSDHVTHSILSSSAPETCQQQEFL